LGTIFGYTLPKQNFSERSDKNGFALSGFRKLQNHRRFGERELPEKFEFAGKIPDMGIGLVDKVLVLGPPSLTIERELTNKFVALSANKNLPNAIPQSSKCSNPSIWGNKPGALNPG
jgi:hypothetical protein